MRAVSATPGPVVGDPGYEDFFWWAFQRSRNPMWIRDLDRIFVEINQAVTDRLGYTRDAVVGRRSDGLVAPTEWKRIDPE
ncbi:MAG: hypothetical protein QOJ29_3436, partial [Thermoleophilaceae bacterium]|nr:hypothetical protein [Thermoleophilaceae bacterium]